MAWFDANDYFIIEAAARDRVALLERPPSSALLGIVIGLVQWLGIGAGVRRQSAAVRRLVTRKDDARAAGITFAVSGPWRDGAL